MMGMKKWIILWLSGLMGFVVGLYVLFVESELMIVVVFYLFVGVLSFDQLISQFCEKFNVDNLKLFLNEFCFIVISCDWVNLICVVSKINENFYVFIVLECGMLKIKFMQIIWLLIQGLE